MEKRAVGGMSLFFEAEEREAAQWIGAACEQSERLIHRLWGLPTPVDCRVYVMTSPLRFVFHSAPWLWRAWLALFLPLWYPRARQTWRFAGGWAQAYGRRYTVGVKPPRLLTQSDRSIGQRIFVPVTDPGEKVRHVICHELTHAFSAHLKLPVWLNEGLAMVTVDQFVGRPTVQPRTLSLLQDAPGRAGTRSYRRARVTDPEAIIHCYVQGYWLTRYLFDTQPDFLESLLARRYAHQALQDRVAEACAIDRQAFWAESDRVVVSHFRHEAAPGSEPRLQESR